MTGRSFILRALIAGLALCSAQAAAAQQGGTQEIAVIAPQVSVQQESRDPAGRVIMVYAVERRVSFADLDLRTAAGVQGFRERIRKAARDGCDQISRDFPRVQDASCVKTAVATAMVRADQVIAAARQ